MKIVNVIQRYPPAVGGAETWAQEVCRDLVKRGHDVTVYAINVNKEEEFWREPLDEDKSIAFGSFENDQGVRVFRFRRSLPIHLLYHLVFKRILDNLLGIYFYGPHSSELYGRLWNALRDADVVFLHAMPHPHNIVAWMIARWHGRKVVIVPHFHPQHPHYEHWSAYYLLERCNAVVADSLFEKEYLAAKGVTPARTIVAGIGVHPERYVLPQGCEFARRLQNEFGIQRDDAVIAFLGRKMPDKGIETLIDAVRVLRKERRVKLLLAGPAFAWFDELYATVTPEERTDIIDLGMLSTEDKVALLHRATLLALPSKFEAFGIVFVEAWICGTAVVGSDQGAIPGIIGPDGFVARYGNVPDLTHILRTALGDPKLLERLAASGKEKVFQLYTWDQIGSQIEQCLIDVAQKPMGGQRAHP